MKVFEIIDNGDYIFGPAKDLTVYIALATDGHTLGGGTLDLYARVNGFTDHWENFNLGGFTPGVKNKVSFSYGPGFEWKLQLSGATAPHITAMVSGV